MLEEITSNSFSSDLSTASHLTCHSNDVHICALSCVVAVRNSQWLAASLHRETHFWVVTVLRICGYNLDCSRCHVVTVLFLKYLFGSSSQHSAPMEEDEVFYDTVDVEERQSGEPFCGCSMIANLARGMTCNHSHPPLLLHLQVHLFTSPSTSCTSM